MGVTMKGSAASCIAKTTFGNNEMVNNFSKTPLHKNSPLIPIHVARTVVNEELQATE